MRHPVLGHLCMGSQNGNTKRSGQIASEATSKTHGAKTYSTLNVFCLLDVSYRPCRIIICLERSRPDGNNWSTVWGPGLNMGKNNYAPRKPCPGRKRIGTHFLKGTIGTHQVGSSLFGEPKLVDVLYNNPRRGFPQIETRPPNGSIQRPRRFRASLL